MMLARCRRTTILVLVLGFPVVALADVSQTKVLAANTLLDLDTGETTIAASRATASGTPDLLWNGTTIAPQRGARAYNVGNLGASSFAGFEQIYFDPFKILASAATLPASVLVTGDVFVVFTDEAHTSKVLVTANSGGSITLQFTTFIAVVPVGPTITQVLNNSSLIAPGRPNYGIAPSSVFVVTGSGLADPGDPVLQSSAAPGLPLTLNGASIAVVVNGVTTHPALYYTSPKQLAAVLPAATPIGTGTLVVTYKGVNSAPAPVQVVPSALGFNTYNTNTGVATDNTSGAILTLTNSGSPGQAIVLWATGLGADPADSDTILASAPHAVSTPLQIYIGGALATILYQGSSGYPGVNQINVVIPDAVPTGCWVSLAAVAGGVVSNIATLPINRGGGPCFDVQSGLDGTQIAPGGARTLRTGFVGLIQTNTTSGRNPGVTTSASAAFEKYTGIYQPNNVVSPGGCIVDDLTPVPIGSITGLDVGAITLTGPAGLSVTMASQLGIKGAFSSNLPAGAIPPSGGTFTFKGSGGADVGSFTSTINLANPVLTWTNQSAAATIDKSKGLLVTWSGGNRGSYVIIQGTSVLGTRIVGYTCLTVADAGQFTVPSYILLALPSGSGGTNVQNQTMSTLSATGLDVSTASATIAFSVASTYGLTPPTGGPSK